MPPLTLEAAELLRDIVESCSTPDRFTWVELHDDDDPDAVRILHARQCITTHHTDPNGTVYVSPTPRGVIELAQCGL